MVWYADSCCPRDHCPSQKTSAKVQTQGLTVKKSKLEESRPKKAKPANSKPFTLSYSNKAIKPNYQEKKKEY